VTCYNPLKAYRGREINKKTGKRPMVFSWHKALGFGLLPPQELPCGQCIGCRLEKSRQWAVRCMHEAETHENNCFLTLTYDEDHLPIYTAPDGAPDVGTLCLEDFQEFMKRFRFRYFGSSKSTIRYFHCGEYGEKLKRPHYHACIFGFDFSDKVLWREKHGQKLFVSEELQELWPNGFHTIGEVNFDSAAYAARYVLKKINGAEQDAHYGGRTPEYTTMSRRPGLGADWFKKFKAEVYPSDEVIVKGKSVRPPRYYDSLFQIEDPEEFASLKIRRKVAGKPDPYVHPRLHVREKVQELKLRALTREVENG